MKIPEDPLARLPKLIQNRERDEITRIFEDLPLADVSFVINRISQEDREKLIDLIPPQQAADLLSLLHGTQAVDIVEDLLPKQAAKIIQRFDSDAAADLLGALDDQEAEAILQQMEPKVAADTRELLAYDPETAGGLMRSDYLAYPSSATVANVVEDLRAQAEIYSDFDVQYAYVVDNEGQLVGVLRLRDLLLSTSQTPVTEIMISNPISAHHSTHQEELARLFDKGQFIGLPVIDEENRLLGVVLRKSVRAAAAEAVAEDFLKVSGLGGKDELRSMPLRLRSGRRLSWLSINIFLNVLAASVIAVFQDTLVQVIALAVFLPIISDMSGCSGSQAVAVSIRELTLGLVRPTEMLRVFGKELALGLINGIALGLLIALVALLWKGNPWLGLVVGSALMINTMVAVSLGGLIPLLLRRYNFDPALASGPILTTVTDMCGFFLVLGMATLMLPYLV